MTAESVSARCDCCARLSVGVDFHHHVTTVLQRLFVAEAFVRLGGLCEHVCALPGRGQDGLRQMATRQHERSGALPLPEVLVLSTLCNK